MWKRAFLVLGFAVLAVFSSVYFGFPGSGGLCTLVMAFLAGMKWSDKKVSFIVISFAHNSFLIIIFLFSSFLGYIDKLFIIRAIFYTYTKCIPTVHIHMPFAHIYQSIYDLMSLLKVYYRHDHDTPLFLYRCSALYRC